MHLFDDFREIVKTDEPLAPYLWFRLGGPAAYFARPRGVEQLAGLIKRCRQENYPFKILSGGSNILASDERLEALVIHLESPAFSDVTTDGTTIEAGGAVPLTALISQSARSGLGGLEIFTGIPGTVGGALRSQAANRHGSIGQYVRKVHVLDKAGEIQTRDRDDLDSAEGAVNLDDPVILSANFVLEPEEPEAVVRRMRRIWIVKKESQPYGHQSTGCMFKNISPDLSAGNLIDQAGLKGTRYGGAEVSDRHANFIVAHPGAKASDILQLASQIRQRIWQQFGYDLQLQIQVW